ncbi:MAG TPA: sigma-70 family RNA polymerase sigma factor [Chthonomonadaceae bacterium]|nr:sigma-70 family RNA polymerase sigma factor [Chthonomonadaceae bacterium]
MFRLRKSKSAEAELSRSLFEDLIRQHQASIYRVAYRLTGNHEDAEDLVQEALIEAFEAFGRFRAGTYFDRWLFRILRNTYIDEARARPKIVLQSLDTPMENDEGTALAREIMDWSSHPESLLLAAELDEPIQQALMSLPEDFRLVVVLSDMEGLSYEEVSRIAGCPVGTVRSRLHRARMLLKAKLKGVVPVRNVG